MPGPQISGSLPKENAGSWGKTENTSPIFGAAGSKLEKNWYYYTKSGKKKTSTWITWKGQRYYVNEKGIRAVHWQKIQKKQYYFDKSGNLKTSSWLKKGSWYYYVNSKGRLSTKERMNTNSLATATKIRYETSTLQVNLEQSEKYGTVSADRPVKDQRPSQIKTPLSYGTYGGARELTSMQSPASEPLLGSTEVHFPIPVECRDLMR